MAVLVRGGSAGGCCCCGAVEGPASAEEEVVGRAGSAGWVCGRFFLPCFMASMRAAGGAMPE